MTNCREGMTWIKGCGEESRVCLAHARWRTMIDWAGKSGEMQTSSMQLLRDRFKTAQHMTP